MSNKITEGGRTAQWIAYSVESLALVIAGLVVVVASALTIFRDDIVLPRELIATVTIGTVWAILIIELRREIMLRRQYRHVIDELLEIKRRLDSIERRVRTVRQRGRLAGEMAGLADTAQPGMPRSRPWWTFR